MAAPPEKKKKKKKHSSKTKLVWSLDNEDMSKGGHATRNTPQGGVGAVTVVSQTDIFIKL